MKKLFFLLPLLLLAGCTMPGISLDRGDEKVDYFEKDALCQNYIDEVKAEATKYDNEYSSHKGFSAFYSPTLNECIVSYSEYYNVFQEGYEEYTVYFYQGADKNHICMFKVGSQESRVACEDNMYYDKSVERKNTDGIDISYVEIEYGPKNENIINHVTQEEKYLRGLK